MSVGTISLEGMEFYAYHGFYDEERKVGNKYTVDVHLTTDFTHGAQEDDLNGTVNYETVYKLVKAQMSESNKLLESIAQKIINSLFKELPQIEAAEVAVSKHNPPIGGVCAKSKITLKQDRK